jgi:hypothetical protein
LCGNALLFCAQRRIPGIILRNDLGELRLKALGKELPDVDAFESEFWVPTAEMVGQVLAGLVAWESLV